MGGVGFFSAFFSTGFGFSSLFSACLSGMGSTFSSGGGGVGFGSGFGSFFGFSCSSGFGGSGFSTGFGFSTFFVLFRFVTWSIVTSSTGNARVGTEGSSSGEGNATSASAMITTCAAAERRTEFRILAA